MSKVFIKRKRLNENIIITDPMLAQQFLAVKKQMVDKKTKRDQLVRNVNQIDAELNILDKNLLAIETKSAQKNGKVNVEQRKEQGQLQPDEETIETSELSEKLSDILVPKSKENLPSFEEYHEMVIEYIDENLYDGETLAHEHESLIHESYEKLQNPEVPGSIIISIEEGEDPDVTSGLELEVEETEEIDDSYIGGDTMGKLAANRSMPVRIVKENLQYKKGMSIEINGNQIDISKVDNYPNFALIYYKDKLGNEQIYNSNWLDEQEVEVIKEPEKYVSPRQLEKLQDDIQDQIQELENDLRYAVQEEKEVEIDMEEDLALYDESTHTPEENPRYSLETKEKIYPEMPHDIWGEKLNIIANKIGEIEDKLRKLYQDPNCETHHSKYSNEPIVTDDQIKAAAIASAANPYDDPKELLNKGVNESIYEDIINDLESEKEKIDKIQDFIYQTTQNIEIDVNLPDEIEIEPPQEPEVLEPEEEEPEVLIPQEVEPDLPPVEEEPPVEEPPVEEEPPSIEKPEPENEPRSQAFDLVHYEKERDIEEPFEPTPDEMITDDTLKAEEDKEPYTPELVEAEDIETEIEMMNYEEDDQPRDEYVFHVRIDGETDHEIVAKFYRDDEDDFWTVRVVKGDEKPLQDMEYDPRLDKLDIIGKVVDIYDDIEIIDPKEYEYLLDDKEKVDQEYYADLVDES